MNQLNQQDALWATVRTLAEGSDWKRGEETLATWAERTIKEVHGLRKLRRAVDAALNSGDGSYKP